MSHTLTQPEEVDRAMMERGHTDWESDPLTGDESTPLQTSPEIPDYGYVSPYRAAHFRSMHSRSNPQS
jgi:hypothetical protein